MMNIIADQNCNKKFMVVDFKTCQKWKLNNKFKVFTTQIMVANESNIVNEKKLQLASHIYIPISIMQRI
jgi:hypothetical protein